jgi:two-component system nitrate/nitrite response regulator NarL
MPPTILIADDHDIVRQGIRATIARLRPEWEICGEVSNGKDAVEAVQNLTPDVVILDVTMPVMGGLDAARQIAKLGLASRILVFTMHESVRMARDVRNAGAHGYVRKSEAARDLIAALEALLSGGTFGFQGQDIDESAEKSGPNSPACFRVFVFA